MGDSFLHLLYAQAPRADLDAVVVAAEQEGLAPERLAALRAEYDVALRLRETIARQRAREAELSALYDTANDLTAIRDVDLILTAIVRRARQLLNADMTCLSLNDEADGASYMKVTDGALTQEFFSELFGTSVRYTGASVGYQLASIFAGALAPIIAVKLLDTGDGDNTLAVALYVTVASVITVVAVLCAKETSGSSLRHDRVLEPR